MPQRHNHESKTLPKLLLIGSTDTKCFEIEGWKCPMRMVLCNVMIVEFSNSMQLKGTSRRCEIEIRKTINNIEDLEITKKNLSENHIVRKQNLSPFISVCSLVF